MDQNRAAQIQLQTTLAMAEAIRELGQVPSGQLYARVMDRISLDIYNTIITTLIRAGVVRQDGYLLTWIG